MTQFVVCGETLIDLVPAESTSDSAGRNDSFSSEWSALAAGGPMNSAVALGQLGAETQFLGRISTDVFGAQLRDHILGAGVGLDHAVKSPQATSIAVVSLDADGKASYTFHFAETANFNWRADELPLLDADTWLHVASLATVVSPGAEVLLEWAQALTCGISLDINVRPSVIGDANEYWRRVEPWLRLVGDHGGILKASDDDVAFLASAATTGDDDPLKTAATWLQDYKFDLAVITVGPNGAVAISPDRTVTRVPGMAVPLVDTVGAGDTFMAGFLDGWVNKSLDLDRALTRGVAAAAIVCGRQGARVPTGDEVDRLLATSGAGQNRR